MDLSEYSTAYMNLRAGVMQGDITKLCVLVATLALGKVWGGGLCERGRSFWDQKNQACTPCTHCDPTLRLVVKYPCEVYRDTICQSIYELGIWPFESAQGDTKDNDVSDDEYYEYTDYDSEVSKDNDGEVTWDLQTTSLTLAASGCVVFFLVVLVMSLYHAKQWKVIKRALKSDVQDLTAKLKLMESGGDAPAEPVVTTDHHLYCNIHLGKEALLGTTPTKKGTGNVYTQEKHPS